MDSQDQAISSSDPPALAPSDHPQQSDDSQDALQDGSSRSSSQMPELEQMEGSGQIAVVVGGLESQEAMEVDEASGVQSAVVEEGQVSSDAVEFTQREDQVINLGEDNQMVEAIQGIPEVIQMVEESGQQAQEELGQVVEKESRSQEDISSEPTKEVSVTKDTTEVGKKPMQQKSQESTQSKEVDKNADDVVETEDDGDSGESSQKKASAKTSKEDKEREPDTKIVLTLAPGGATSTSKGQTSDGKSTTEGKKREVVLSFNIQDMLAATEVKEADGRQSTKAMPVSVNVAVPHTRQASKRVATVATKQSPVSTPAAKKPRRGAAPATPPAEFAEAIGLKSNTTPAQSTPPQGGANIRRSNRRKSGTPKWRPQDLLESEESESSAEEGEVKLPPSQMASQKKKARPLNRQARLKAKTPTPSAQPKKTPTVQTGRKVIVKSEPVERPAVKVKEEKDLDWYNGKPKTAWSRKEERAVVTYITDWQKQPSIDEVEEEEEEEEVTTSGSKGQISQREWDEMNFMIPKKNDKDWKDCADYVSKSTQKPVREASSCYDFALTIQECMTNEGAMEHYNLDLRKVKSFTQTANTRKPVRNKEPSSKSFWTDEEEQALVVFILNWQIKPKAKMVKAKVKVTRLKVKPVTKPPPASDGEFTIMPAKSNLWEDCAKFISRKACLPKRTGYACRTFALGIQKKFTKEEAIKHYEVDSDEADSDIEEVQPSSASYDAYMQDDSFIFNLWISEMGRLTKYQEDHVLHKLLLKKIDRNEFSSSEFLYYFKHLSRTKQEETADLLLATGHGGSADAAAGENDDGEDNAEKETVKVFKVSSSKLDQFTAFASHKRRALENFNKQMQVNLHQSERQLKNMREILSKVQNENKTLKAKVKNLKQVIDRISNTKPARQAWSLDMDAELNPIRKRHLFQWLLLNGYIPRMPDEQCVVPKGLFYCMFSAMEELEVQGRPNAVFHLAKALCLRKTNGERVMPANRMPFALLEANIMFFGGKGYNFIQQEGYKRWVETQYAWFGEVWFSLFGGPNMKSLAGEEPKPLLAPTDADDVTIKKERVYSYSYKPRPEPEYPSLDDKRFTLSMCPEGFTPSDDEQKDYIQVGTRWGKMHPIDDSDGKASDSGSPVSTRRSARRKTTSEGEASTSQGDAESLSPMKSPGSATTPSSGRRRGKTAAISYTLPKEPRGKITKMSPPEPMATALDIDDIDKFLEEVNDGVLPEGLKSIWDDPPDFTFEDDFLVPENSDLNKVRLNIVSGTPRAVRRRAVERENISEPDATIRVELLQQLHRINPSAKWWIKTGWCEISANKSLRITGKQEFTGDENLGDGAIQEAEEEYKTRLKNTRAIGIATRKSESALREDLFRQIADLQNDNVFLCEGLRQVRGTKGVYKNKMGVPERAAVDAVVDKEISSYSKLLEKNQHLRARVERALTQGTKGVYKNKMGVPERAAVDAVVDKENSSYSKLLEKNQHLRARVERALTQGSKARVITLRNDLCEYLNNLTIRQRTVANHILIFMVSDELQNENPYSWPVRMVPVATVTREIVESLRDQLIEAMTKEDMHIVGIIRDELTPHLQVCHPDRPVCITQLINDSRTEVSTFHPSEMEKYFTTVTLFSRSGDMKLTPQWRHGAVPEEDVLWVHKHMSDKNASFLEGLQALHKNLFPEGIGYIPQPFKQITKYVDMDAQMLEDQLRALMAIYIYRHKIKTYKAEGIDFDSYMYFPTSHPVTQDTLHVRDSVTKLLRAVSRQAKDDMDLTAEKKQRLSRALDGWFKASVNKWWSADMRKEGNHELLAYIVDEWIPWLSAERGYSTIDVNRPISKVTFLSEDLLTSLIMNLESENLRPSLHPLAATCQDVNTFVHLIKNPGQRHNDSRQVMHPQIIKKLCVEFAKAVDPELEFYYYWGDHEKTLYNILLNLNDPRTKRSATGPKYRKKSIGCTPAKQAGTPRGGKIVKVEEVDDDDEEHSRDATEEDMEGDEMMDVSGIEEEESVASSTHSRGNQPQQIIDMDPIPISINQADIVIAPSAINQEDIDTAQALNQLSDMDTIQVLNQSNMQVVRVLNQGETVGNQGEVVRVVRQGEPARVSNAGQMVRVVRQGEGVQVGNKSQRVQIVSQGNTVAMGDQRQIVQVVSQEEAAQIGSQGDMQTVQAVASRGNTGQMANQGQFVQVVSQGEPIQVGNQGQMQTVQSVQQRGTIQVENQGDMQRVVVSRPADTVQVGNQGQIVQVVSQGGNIQSDMQTVQAVASQGNTVQIGNQGQMIQVVRQGVPGNQVQFQTVQAVSQGETVQMRSQDQMIQVVSQGEPIQINNQGQMETVQAVSQGEVQMGNQRQMIVVSQGEPISNQGQMQTVQAVNQGEVQMGNEGQMVQIVNQNEMERVQVVSQAEQMRVEDQGQMVQVMSQGDMETVQVVNQGEQVENQEQMVQVVSQEEAIQFRNQGQMQTVQVVVSQGETIHMGNQGQMIQVVHQGEMEAMAGAGQEEMDAVQVVHQDSMGETVQVVDQGQMDTVQVVDQGQMETVQVVDQGQMETVQVVDQGQMETVQVVDQGQMETVQVVDPGQMETVQVVDQGQMEAVQVVDQGQMETVQVVDQGQMETVQVVDQGQMETVQVVNQGQMEAVQVVDQGQMETVQVVDQGQMETVQVVDQGQMETVQVVDQGQMDTVQVVTQADGELSQATTQAVTVTTSAPSQEVATEGVSSSAGQPSSSEDIIAQELLRQIEASLQSGGAVVTVTESSEG